MTSCRSDEHWLPIPGLDGLYEASDMGRIRRTGHEEPLRVKYTPRRGGRTDARLNISVHGVIRTCEVSRLVAMAWCPGYSAELTVNHINGDTHDNRAANLEWVTIRENIRKGYEAGAFSRARPITLEGPDGRRSFPSLAAAARAVGTHRDRFRRYDFFSDYHVVR